MRRLTILPTLAFVLLSAPAVWSQVRGPEIVLNSATQGPQWQPAVATAGNGDFVVVWTDGGVRLSPSRVKARIFSGQGVAKTGEILVSGPEAAYASEPAVTVGPAGAFIVVWRGLPNPNGPSQIYARRFAADGSPLAGAFLVSRCQDCQQREPDVARAPDGRFTVAWTELDGGVTSIPHFGRPTTDVMVRRFGADGKPLGSKQRVGHIPFGLESEPDVAMARDGSIVVAFTWDDEGNPDAGGLTDVFVARITADGTPVDMRQVNDLEHSIGGYQHGPSLALRPDGRRFAVLWRDELDTRIPGSSTLYVQVFDEYANQIGPKFRVSEDERYFEEGTVAWLPSGELMVAWQSTNVRQGPSERGFDIFVRRFTADGVPVSQGDIELNTFTPGNQSEPVIAVAPNGRGVVVWQSMRRDGNDFAVAARRVVAP